MKHSWCYNNVNKISEIRNKRPDKTNYFFMKNISKENLNHKIHTLLLNLDDHKENVIIIPYIYDGPELYIDPNHIKETITEYVGYSKSHTISYLIFNNLDALIDGEDVSALIFILNTLYNLNIKNITLI